LRHQTGANTLAQPAAGTTLLGTPASLSRPPDAALGTRAGPTRIRAVTADAGFTRLRRVAPTQFNQVYEVGT
jgi:hypothetical protein